MLKGLSNILPPYAYKKNLSVQHFSDILRIVLLERHGGVWVDATAYCILPLDGWLPPLMQADFFGFSNCGRSASVASWFLASQPSSLLICSWRECADRYWELVDTAHQYFWVHQLFSRAVHKDSRTRQIYNCMPRVDASGPLSVQRFAEARGGDLSRTERLRIAICSGCIPVAKLSRWPGNSSAEEVCARES